MLDLDFLNGSRIGWNAVELGTFNLYRLEKLGMMMLQCGEADGRISGLTQHYPDTLRPALQIIGKKAGVRRVAGLYMLIFKQRFATWVETITCPPFRAEGGRRRMAQDSGSVFKIGRSERTMWRLAKMRTAVH